MIYFCADDYGLCEEASRHIQECVDCGALNKVSVFPNFKQPNLKKLIDNPEVRLSLHLNLVEGKCMTPADEIPMIADENGNFKHTFTGLLKLNLLHGKKFEDQVYKEIRAQVLFWKSVLPETRRFCVDSHQHTAMIPGVFKALMRVLDDENIDLEHMRIPIEPILPYIKTPSLYFTYRPVNLIKQWLLNFLWLINKKNAKKHKVHTSHFFGILFSGKMDEKRVRKVLPGYEELAKKDGLDIEVLFHPGYLAEEKEEVKSIVFQEFYLSKNRITEYDSVMKLTERRRPKMPFIEQEKVDEKTRAKLEAIIKKSYASYWKKKRLFDIFFATLILLFFLPLMIIIALVIVIDDPSAGPFYKQIRCGRHGKEFYMYKFRTMRANADKMLDDLIKQNEMDGPVFKIKEDPRITRVGKFLRKVSLDELMQFFNVLKGDMTLVGPRPPLPREVQYYTDYQKLRLLVTPGITCTWQIHENRNDVPFEEWVEMDIEYIQTRTYLNDLKIMLKTPIVMLTATGR